jgi:hypothetical protein
MIPFDEFKKLLGSEAEGLSDVEIERIRDIEHRLADIIFDAWLQERNSPPEVAHLREN